MTSTLSPTTIISFLPEWSIASLLGKELLQFVEAGECLGDAPEDPARDLRKRIRSDEIDRLSEEPRDGQLALRAGTPCRAFIPVTDDIVGAFCYFPAIYF